MMSAYLLLVSFLLATCGKPVLGNGNSCQGTRGTACYKDKVKLIKKFKTPHYSGCCKECMASSGCTTYQLDDTGTCSLFKAGAKQSGGGCDSGQLQGPGSPSPPVPTPGPPPSPPVPTPGPIPPSPGPPAKDNVVTGIYAIKSFDSKQKELRGIYARMDWSDIQTSENEFSWRKLDSILELASSTGMGVLLQIDTGFAAPSWIYKSGVKKVKVDSETFPCYLNPPYTEYFTNMHKNVYNHLKSLPSNLREPVWGVQGAFGSTGDFGPWHGTPKYSPGCTHIDEYGNWVTGVNGQGGLQNWIQMMYDTYQPDFQTLFNQGNSDQGDLDSYINECCPGSYRKAGDQGHGYQLNGEQTQWDTIGKECRSTEKGHQIRCRSELSRDITQAGYWEEAPTWNMVSLVESALTFGLDFLMVHPEDYDSDGLGDVSAAWNFFNKYAGQKDAATSPGAWLSLRQALDSSNTQLFPKSKYPGSVNEQNTKRMEDIAKTFKDYGAKQQDPSAASNVNSQRTAKALNDVAFGVWQGNYGMHMTQLDPNDTSVAYWRVGKKTGYYGRYARGLEHKTGKNTMRFQMADGLFSAMPEGSIMLRIAYFDDNNGKFSVAYSTASGCTNPTIFQKKASDDWQEVSVPLANAKFSKQCEHNSDLVLSGISGKDTIFGRIEITSGDNLLQDAQMKRKQKQTKKKKKQRRKKNKAENAQASDVQRLFDDEASPPSQSDDVGLRASGAAVAAMLGVGVTLVALGAVGIVWRRSMWGATTQEESLIQDDEEDNLD